MRPTADSLQLIIGHITLFMMLVGLGTALWGASSFPHASAFASPAFLSSAASNAFVSRRSAVAATSGTLVAPRRRRQQQHLGGSSSSSGGMVMLFDFIKQRAQEGVEQTQNLVTAAQTGRLDEALKETSAYVQDRRVSTAVSTSSTQLAAVVDYMYFLSIDVALAGSTVCWCVYEAARTAVSYIQQACLSSFTCGNGDFGGGTHELLYT